MIYLLRYTLVLSLLVIFTFALLPGQLTPAYVVNHDKAAHALAFLVLSFMLYGGFPALTLRVRLILLISLALLIEATQYWFVGRGFSPEDLLYDAAGIILFWVLRESINWLLLVSGKLTGSRPETPGNG